MKKILLVEDNELNRDMLGRRLKRRGYTVVVAIDGQEGVFKAQAERPDLILMDMSLPVMDGWTATAQLKANPQTALIPVIALTAHAMVGDRDKAMAAGCDDYDTKPVDIRRLLEKIETLLSRSSASSDQAATTQKASVPSQPITPSVPELKLQADTSDTQADHVNLSISVPAQNNSPPAPPSDQAMGKILVVDDVEENRDMLSRRLIKKGYDVALAESGEAALALLENTNIALVLLDVMMPGIGGIETLRQIRQRYSQLEIPVIMVTAKDQSEDIVQAFDLGANDYITKPIDLSVLLVRIQAQLKTVNLSHLVPVRTSEPKTATKKPKFTERYQSIEILSNSPICQTFIAQDLQNSEAPLKLIQKIQLQISDPQVLDTAKEIFASEVKLLKSVPHNDGILNLIDAFEEAGNFYVVNEYIDGTLLSINSAEIPAGNTTQVITIMEDMLRLIGYLHFHDIIHHKIDMSCFMLSKQHKNKLILIDNGLKSRLALKLKELYPNRAFLSSNSEIKCFIESLKEGDGVKADIWSIGMISLQLLTGQSQLSVFNKLRFDQSKWSAFDSFNRDLVAYLQKMICQNSSGAYKSVSEANRDIFKLRFELMYRSSTAIGK